MATFFIEHIYVNRLERTAKGGTFILHDTFVYLICR
jgi:hypothetical protein